MERRIRAGGVALRRSFVFVRSKNGKNLGTELSKWKGREEKKRKKKKKGKEKKKKSRPLG